MSKPHPNVALGDGIRFIRPEKFMGEMRYPGDFISSADLERRKISATALEANRNLGTIEFVRNGVAESDLRPSGAVPASAADHRIARLEAQVERLIDQQAKLTEIFDAYLRAKPQEAPQPAKRGRGRPPGSKSAKSASAETEE